MGHLVGTCLKIDDIIHYTFILGWPGGASAERTSFLFAVFGAMVAVKLGYGWIVRLSSLCPLLSA